LGDASAVPDADFYLRETDKSMGDSPRHRAFALVGLHILAFADWPKRIESEKFKSTSYASIISASLRAGVQLRQITGAVRPCLGVNHKSSLSNWSAENPARLTALRGLPNT
jgi:hypothetical protein